MNSSSDLFQAILAMGCIATETRLRLPECVRASDCRGVEIVRDQGSLKRTHEPQP